MCIEMYLKICEKTGRKQLNGTGNSGWEWWVIGYSIFNPCSPDCWENMCHELIAKQMLSRKQPGAVRQNMLENRKTLFFFIRYLTFRYKDFQHLCQLDVISLPIQLFGLQEPHICRFDSPIPDFHRYFSLCTLKRGCQPWGWNSQSVL